VRFVTGPGKRDLGTLELEDERVRLRLWRREDAPVLAAVCGEAAVCTFTSVPWTYSPATAEAWVERQRSRRPEDGAVALAIERIGEGGDEGAGSPLGEVEPAVPVGAVNSGRREGDGAVTSLGYWLVPDARGKGLASAAARLLCAWGFAELGLRRIELEIRPDNLASQRLAERLGATREGLRPESHLAEGQRWDMVLYSLSPAS
jgi:ribosomal-protein-alanine N-acetyltransferase